jgi:hypothetical protein
MLKICSMACLSLAHSDRYSYIKQLHFYIVRNKNYIYVLNIKMFTFKVLELKIIGKCLQVNISNFKNYQNLGTGDVVL